MSDLLKRLKANPVAVPEETVFVAAWDCNVTLRGWTARERDLFEEAQFRRNKAIAKAKGVAVEDVTDLENVRARLVAHCVWEKGKRPLANAEGERLLGDQPAQVLEPLVNAAQRLNGMSRRDLEELAKNSATTRDGDSSSVSPSPSGEPLPN